MGHGKVNILGCQLALVFYGKSLNMSKCKRSQLVHFAWDKVSILIELGRILENITKRTKTKTGPKGTFGRGQSQSSCKMILVRIPLSQKMCVFKNTKMNKYNNTADICLMTSNKDITCARGLEAEWCKLSCI